MLFNNFQLVLPVEPAACTVVEMTLAFIPVLLLWIQAVSGQSGCQTGAFVYKSHTWNKGDSSVYSVSTLHCTANSAVGHLRET